MAGRARGQGTFSSQTEDFREEVAICSSRPSAHETTTEGNLGGARGGAVAVAVARRGDGWFSEATKFFFFFFTQGINNGLFSCPGPLEIQVC